ncbi:MAG: prolipoprotein diacylglyceryl transferase [Candidatus Marinimicrobia bacterium]|nr:prolipoprotein diacylglyceryl transferase [Candidatus Neomarinimicrobiota bacterium]
MNHFVEWWQHLPSHMDPVIFTIGNFPLRWYGMMYIASFAVTYLVAKYRIKDENMPYSTDFIADAIMWAIVGVILGGRLGYVIFYGFEDFIQHPLRIISPVAKIGGHWRFTGISGMSFHGGISGVAVAFWLYARKHKIQYFKLTDLLMVGIPLGYFFGRIGNFINGELYGRLTTSWIGMYFPHAKDGLLRHPSQLYEAFFEGIVLFILLWVFRKKSPFYGFLSGLFIFGYGFVRFFIEYFRQPDAHLGFVFLNFSMGQVLCFFMMLAGGLVWYLGYSQQKNDGELAK